MAAYLGTTLNTDWTTTKPPKFVTSVGKCVSSSSSTLKRNIHKSTTCILTFMVALVFLAVLKPYTKGGPSEGGRGDQRNKQSPDAAVCMAQNVL